MDTEYFIAKKLNSKKKENNQFSNPIIRISFYSIVIGIAIMIITVSIVTGFQEKIRQKVIGFGSHIQITNMEDNTSMESSPLLLDSGLYKTIKNHSLISHIQRFAYKPAILQSEKDTAIIKLQSQIDTAINQDVLGVLFKGIDTDFDWSFFENKIIEGEIINQNSKEKQAIISYQIANKLHYQLGDKINAYFIINNIPKKRTFIVQGIYKTGLEEFDKKIIFTNLNHIQSINNWGMKSAITLKDTCINNKYVLEGIKLGSQTIDNSKWNNTLSSNQLKTFSGTNNETHVFKIESQFKTAGYYHDSTIIHIDSSIIYIKVDSACPCKESNFDDNQIIYQSDSLIIMPFGKIFIKNGKGTQNKYSGGYEVLISEWDDLDKLDEFIYENIPFELKTNKITDLYSEIFSWLSFLDMNIIVVLSMMLIVSLINMTTSLLVLIIEKTNFIGIFKAFGATNWSIRKIFIYNSILLLFKGLLWGNIIGISLMAIQYYTQIIPLDAEIYYLDYVPVNIDFYNILLLNITTIIICFSVLVIPSFLISKITPIKAIKFN